MQINAVIIESYVAFYVWRLFCTDSEKIYAELSKILINIHCSAVILNAKDYILYFNNICEKKKKNISIEVIQYINYEDLQINISNKNSPALFFGILYYTTIIYEDICTSFRLGELHILFTIE